MPIDFHDEKNRGSYATRTADESWKTAVQSLIDPRGLRVVDVGCGGGIYTRAWVDLGAIYVTGVDSSKAMVEAAREQCADKSNVSVTVGDAIGTGLNGASVDIVFERALIHHLNDLGPAMVEAFRLLAPAGCIIIQDRTPADIGLPSSAEHIRGYIFERFPRLLDIEQGRRWAGDAVQTAMMQAGFGNIAQQSVWETRQVYNSFPALAEDLRKRTGRSILHELTDAELDELIDYIASKLAQATEIVERDRWTLWLGVKRVI